MKKFSYTPCFGCLLCLASGALVIGLVVGMFGSEIKQYPVLIKARQRRVL